ncbi:DUF441 domain-containing protein [Mycoplasmatota bacterium]|nr:DUF441 domain-containing protein [Mycoplasmatota bacterium]
MYEKLILLAVLLLLGIFSKNQTIIIAVLVLIGMVLLKLNNETLTTIKKFSIKYGIILITIYAFIPIAKGDITYHDLLKAITTWRAWVAIFAGVLVTHFAKFGIEMMSSSPDVVTFVLVGIIIGMIIFKGVASGPLIGSGIALMLYSIIDFIVMIFK